MVMNGTFWLTNYVDALGAIIFELTTDQENSLKSLVCGINLNNEGGYKKVVPTLSCYS